MSIKMLLKVFEKTRRTKGPIIEHVFGFSTNNCLFLLFHQTNTAVQTLFNAQSSNSLVFRCGNLKAFRAITILSGIVPQCITLR